jgi:hypothetical protein
VQKLLRPSFFGAQISTMFGHAKRIADVCERAEYLLL